MIKERFLERINTLPDKTGVYFMRDSSGNVINQDKEGEEDCKVEVKDIKDENAHMITIIMIRKDGKKIQISKRINK